MNNYHPSTEFPSPSKITFWLRVCSPLPPLSSSKTSRPPSIQLLSGSSDLLVPSSLAKPTWTRWVWVLLVCRATTVFPPETLLIPIIALVVVLLEVLLLQNLTLLLPPLERILVVLSITLLTVVVWPRSSLHSGEFLVSVKFCTLHLTKLQVQWLTQCPMFTHSLVS